jgi:hypothetical protein
MGIITDILALWNQIIGSKPRIKLEYFEYRPNGYGPIIPRGSKKIIASKILLKNKSDKPTTIEKIFADLNGYLLEPELHSDGHQSKLIDIHPHSSKTLNFESMISEDEFDKLKKKKGLKFSIHIHHTYGKIKKSKIVN